MPPEGEEGGTPVEGKEGESKQSGSLLATPAGEEGKTPDPEPWFHREGVAGEGPKPEWLSDRYKTVEDQAKAYPELDKRFGAFTGAPKEGNYELNLPEGIQGKFDEENPVLKDLMTWGKDHQLSQKGFDTLLGQYAEALALYDVENREAELAALGEDGPQVIKDVDDWAKANLNEEEYELCQRACVTADTLNLVKILKDKVLASTNIPAQEAGQVGAKTVSELQLEYMGNPLYHASTEAGAEFRAKYEKELEIALAAGQG